MNAIPFLDLGAAYRELQPELEASVLRALRSGWYIGGSEVEEFERAYADYCDTAYCVGVANGLDALALSLRALEVVPGDEVIVPSNTFIATWLAVSQCGATIVPVEPDAATGNIDVGRIEAAITPRTRVIVPVHLYGQPADLDPILELANRWSIYVLEDAAQAQGACYKGQRLGGHGTLVAWSFYPGKNLGALGDAGAITTQNAGLAEKLRMLRNYGSKEKYVHELAGFNSRLDPIQAAALCVKLKHLDEWNQRRKALATRYLAGLADCGVGLPRVPEWADPVWHLFVIRTNRRDDLMKALGNAGITTQIHYPKPPHLHQAYSHAFPAEAYPVANMLSSQLLSLPIGPQMRLDDVDRVVDCIANWAGR
jgi:dTDP-4-amino-4,6-dideoxygalactose transaminase